MNQEAIAHHCACVRGEGCPQREVGIIEGEWAKLAWAWIKVWFLRLALAWGAVVFVYAAVSLMLAWLVYWWSLLVSPWFLASAAWAQLVLWLGPPPVPTYSQRAAATASYAYEMVHDYWSSPLTLIGITTVVASYFALKLATSYVSRVALAVQGFSPEALMPGSEYMKASTPNYQIGVEQINTFTTTHIGYALRLGRDWLVMPEHVWGHRETLALRGLTGNVVVSMNDVVSSNGLSDVIYKRLPPEVWSRLGAKTTKVVTNVPLSVSCTGLKGASTGACRKLAQMGMLSYAGSTQPGMSGAAYHSNGQLVGMHLGQLTSKAINGGVAAFYMMCELELHMRGEAQGVSYASAGLAEQSARVAGVATSTSWGTSEVRAHLRKKFSEAPEVSGDTNWADYMEDFYEEAAVPKTKLGLEVPLEALATMRMTPHADDCADYQVQYASARVLARIEKLEEEVKELRATIARAGESKEKIPAGHQCEHCPQRSRTEEAMARHVKEHVKKECDRCGHVSWTRKGAKHDCSGGRPGSVGPSGIKPESAIPSDFRKNVKQTPFLGQQPRSGRRSVKNSPKTSRSGSEGLPYRRLEENQSQMLMCLKDIASSLKKLPQVTDGPALGRQRN